MYVFIFEVSSGCFCLSFLPGIRIGYSIPYYINSKTRKKLRVISVRFFISYRQVVKILLLSSFSTVVVKLFDSCAKALSHIWKSFLTAVKKLKSRILYTKKQLVAQFKTIIYKLVCLIIRYEYRSVFIQRFVTF